MLKETYLANLKNVPAGAVKVWVARPAILSPSKELLKDWKGGKITWSEYETRYKAQILADPKAVSTLKRIKELSEYKDVYLYCYEKNPPCHRFILFELIREEIKDNAKTQGW